MLHSSHMSLLSHPKEVATVIEEANRQYSGPVEYIQHLGSNSLSLF